jgi:hypothetical protein
MNGGYIMKYRLSPDKCRDSNIYKFNMNNDSGNEGTGFLEIIVTDAQTDMPLANVDIEVIKLTIFGQYAECGISELVVRYSTSVDGKIPLIELPVIEWPLSRYFAQLDIFGYHGVTLVNIPIYEGIKTIYHVKMNRITSPPAYLRDYIRTPTRLEYYTPPLWFY